MRPHHRSKSTTPHQGWQTECIGTLLDRLHTCLQQASDSRSINLSSPMHFNDMLAAYYYRKAQAGVAVHVCQVGYCRKSKSEPCKYRLPSEEIVLADEPNDEAVLTKHRRVYMKDDAWLKSVSLRTLLYSGMNVQTNVHHPDGAHKGLLYSVKYQLKDEPRTMLKGVSPEDHGTDKYFKTQFLSASQATAFMYDEEIFHSRKKHFGCIQDGFLQTKNCKAFGVDICCV